MAKDVDTALEDILTQYLASSLPDEDNRGSPARKLIQEMRENGRYLMDVWS